MSYTLRKKRKVVAIMSLVFVFILLSVALVAGNKTNASAEAVTSNTSIGSLTLSNYETRPDGKVFDVDVIGKLYGAIMGNGGTSTYTDAYNKVKGSTTNINGYSTTDPDSLSSQPNSIEYSKINNGNGIKLERLFMGRSVSDDKYKQQRWRYCRRLDCHALDERYRFRGWHCAIRLEQSLR